MSLIYNNLTGRVEDTRKRWDSVQSRERNFGLKYNQNERAMYDNDLWNTYNGWRSAGRQVIKGEKSKRVKGQNIFHIQQTKAMK